MNSLILVSNFNLFEGLFWLTLGLIAAYQVQQVGDRYTKLALFLACVLITFAISDFLQVQYGSFLVPGMGWLYIWKIIDLIGLLVAVVWYLYLRLTD